MSDQHIPSTSSFISKAKQIQLFFLFAILFFSHHGGFAKDSPNTIRLGVLAFGTLNWEIAVMRNEGLDLASGLVLETTPLASAEAGKIALQGGSIDMIVTDWIWVAHQREQGSDLTFAPYSTAHGALMVPAASLIRNIADLKGKRLGIAGGGLDKNWLLLRALAQKVDGLDFNQALIKIFAAPPLLNQQLEQGNLDAVLNYWNFAAKLEGMGYRKLLDGREILQKLGMTTEVPSLGYVFHESWAKGNTTSLMKFFEASVKAKTAICRVDSVWQKIASLTQESNEKVRQTLREHYCEGQTKSGGDSLENAAAEIYQLLHQFGEGQHSKSSGKLPRGVFWEPGSEEL